MKLNLKIGSLLVIILLLTMSLAIWYYCYDLPSLSALEKKQSPQIIHIDYRDSSRLINYSEITDNQIEFYQIPWQLIKAVVLTEDRRFFSHPGIDIIGIIRAYYTNYRAGRIVQGGSTITQQLAKMLFLQPQKTLKRKIQEAILALQIEQYFTKQQIITFYLNRAYFGSGNYGIKQASLDFFNKPVSQLNLYESAMLAGILKAPSKISPKNNFTLANHRARTILEIIEKNPNISGIQDNKNFNFINQAKYYFSDLVLTIFNQQFKELKNHHEELFITSTINQQIQLKLETKLNQYFQENIDNISSRQIAVMVANYSGEILAMIGGKNYRQNRFNHAIDDNKMIGNMIDNFIYLSALENGMKIDQVFFEQPSNYWNSSKQSPKNIQKKYDMKNLTLSNAFSSSSQSITKQILNQLGEKKIIDTIVKSGIDKFSKKNYLNQNLTNEIFWKYQFSLYDLIAFFTTIANDGIIVKPHVIKDIKDSKQNKIFQHKSAIKQRLLKKSSVQDLKKILKNSVKNGDHKIANLNDDVIGKIGYYHDHNGYYAIGFDQQKIIGIWMEQPSQNQFKNILNKKNLGDLFARLFNEI